MITLPGNVARFVARQREQDDHQRKELGIEARSWFRITNQADPDEAEVMIYDEIGRWWGTSADDLIAELRQITSPRIRLRINSPGGSVFEGVAIANAFRSHAASVTVQVDAVAASIASVIAMAGDRIEMAPNSMMMIHDASGLCYGNAAEMEEMAELLDLLSDNIADAYAARAGGTREQWRDRMRAETWYLPDDAVENGLADEALQAPKSGTPSEPEPEPDEEPDMARAWDLAVYGYAGPRREEPKAEAGLTEDIRGLIGEEVAAQLRAAVSEPGVEEPAEPAVEEPDEGPAEPDPAAQSVEEPAALAEEPAAEPGPEPIDEWAALTAHLTEGDAWSALVSHLTEPDTSSSAATA
ncbi:head maturation protease, ClpP-related [Streptomyces chartreusis]|uniref:head maturation protease, ClpP-related n=1 Tax=Streptomyces chartreusis TaxID=1969 RepID=UPI0035E3656A